MGDLERFRPMRSLAIMIQKKSCVTISDYLNTLGIPPAYTRDQRELLRGKRKVATTGIWRPGRIRNMLVNPTYKGVHHYGRRSKRDREVIERAVPAIVSVELWERAQQVLHEHLLFSRRNAKYPSLTRHHQVRPLWPDLYRYNMAFVQW